MGGDDEEEVEEEEDVEARFFSPCMMRCSQ